MTATIISLAEYRRRNRRDPWSALYAANLAWWVTWAGWWR